MNQSSLIILLIPLFFLSSSALAVETVQSSRKSELMPSTWVHSDQLKPGMKILTADNKVLTVKESWQPREQTATTYNFEVANSHTYFIGEQKLWAHNNGVCDETGLLQNNLAWPRKMYNRYQIRKKMARYERCKGCNSDMPGVNRYVGGEGTWQETAFYKDMPVEEQMEFLLKQVRADTKTVLNSSNTIDSAALQIHVDYLRNPTATYHSLRTELNRLLKVHNETNLSVELEIVNNRGGIQTIGILITNKAPVRY